ncbi:uncharacterized protein Fot_31798 [Forsythia ovata]|uniref:Uncharacterized protein n=1 Tax=Forsythia ovata TaxID=205694 RepID=A0ABD1T691_9LAMI
MLEIGSYSKYLGYVWANSINGNIPCLPKLKNYELEDVSEKFEQTHNLYIETVSKTSYLTQCYNGWVDQGGKQKQYFEQRKRQQQQQAAGSENHADGRHSCSQHHGNERSLDILSFMNLSTVTQEQKSSCLVGRDIPENETFPLNYQNAHHSPEIHTKKGFAADHFETNEGRPSSCDHVETVFPKKLSVGPPDHKEGLTGNGDKLKLATQCHEISVIDLLGDDGSHGTAEEISVHAQESHVAFSVEEARRQASTSKNFKYSLDDFESQMDAMVEDIDFSLYNDSIDQPFCSGNNIFGNPKPEFSNFRNSLPFNRYGNNLKDVLEDDVILYDMKDSNENIWNGSTFPCNHVDNVGEYELFCKNQVDLRADGYADCLSNNKHWRRDFNFEGSCLQEIRASKHGTENIDIIEPHSPYTKLQISEYLHNFEISDARWYPTIGIDHNLKDASNQPARACFIREHERESLSLSEESCSSSAVRGDEIKKSPTRKQGTKVHGIHGWSQENKCFEKNIHGKERKRGNRSHLQQGESINQLGKFTRTPEASLTPACFRTTTFESNPFCQTSGMRKRSSSGPSAWSKDVFDLTSDPQLIIDSNTPFKRSTELPHSPISEKMYFCRPFSHVYPHETPISQNMKFESTAPNLSQDSKGNTALGSLRTISYLGLEKESLSRDGEKDFDIPSIVEGNIELQMDVSDGSKDLSSKMGSPSISPNRTPEMKESMKGTDSTDLAEDTSSSVEILSTSGLGGIQLRVLQLPSLQVLTEASAQRTGQKDLDFLTYLAADTGGPVDNLINIATGDAAYAIHALQVKKKVKGLGKLGGGGWPTVGLKKPAPEMGKHQLAECREVTEVCSQVLCICCGGGGGGIVRVFGWGWWFRAPKRGEIWGEREREFPDEMRGKEE